MDQTQKLPDYVVNHRTHTIGRYANLIYKKIKSKETFEVEYLFKYLNEDNRDKVIEILNKKGLNYTKWQLLFINELNN